MAEDYARRLEAVHARFDAPEVLFRMMHFMNGLWAPRWRHGKGFAGGVEQAKARLGADLAPIAR